jgi:hypothetical protein
MMISQSILRLLETMPEVTAALISLVTVILWQRDAAPTGIPQAARSSLPIVVLHANMRMNQIHNAQIHLPTAQTNGPIVPHLKINHSAKAVPSTRDAVKLVKN